MAENAAFAGLGAGLGVVGRIIGPRLVQLGLRVIPKAALPAIGRLSDKILRQMKARGWTVNDIIEAYNEGRRVPAVNKATGGAATHYVHPRTGQSVVIDNATGKAIQVGGKGFRWPGDLPSKP